MTRRRVPPRNQALAAQGLRCAIYARKSTTAGLEQEFNSLDAQRAVCLSYIEQQPGWQPIETRYEDGGFTGANLERPAFARLMQDVNQGLIDIVVVYKVDRLSRSLADFTRCIEHLTEAGVCFVSVTERFSTADAMGRLTMNMLASFAEFERGMVSERTRDKIQASRKRGLWTGGTVPIGYVSRNKKLIIDEPRAELVRHAFALCQRQRCISGVARALEAAGYPPPPSRRCKTAGGRWSLARLAALLRNPVYAGFLRHGDELVAGEHPPIVELAVYQEVQAVLEAGEAGPRRTGGGADTAYSLRGLLRCGACGAPMLPSSTKSRGTVYRYYRCSTRIKIGSVACTGKLVPASEVERVVVEQLQGVVSTPAVKAQVADVLRAKLSERTADADKVRAHVTRAMATISASRQALADRAHAADALALDELRSRLNDEAQQLDALRARMAAVDRELSDIEAASKDIDWMLGSLDHLPTVWQHMTPPNRWRLLGALVDRIIVREADQQIDVVLLNLAAARAANRRMPA